eukprot:TRINITY_DN63360_c0_g1_i1.p1 TRINITY_DN63360_c0_g1~~TRINITY_DN63360_c0_g1_i1.p1  ORF type:complete len:596 (-),score=29.15 TRINITY_DN63360_c0_g1_i1:287-2074(-)
MVTNNVCFIFMSTDQWVAHYTLFSALKLMGCRPLHSQQITDYIFDWAKHDGFANILEWLEKEKENEHNEGSGSEEELASSSRSMTQSPCSSFNQNNTTTTTTTRQETTPRDNRDRSGRASPCTPDNVTPTTTPPETPRGCEEWQEDLPSERTRTITRATFDELIKVSMAMQGYQKPNLGDFMLAHQLIERRRPLVILFGGTSGSGKSTLASLLAARLGLSTVLSTDSVRHMLRGVSSKEECPELYASTYQAYLAVENTDHYKNLTLEEKVLEGWREQSRLVVSRLEEVIISAQARNEPLVVEGVHLQMPFMFELMARHRYIIPFLIYISNERKHKERFAVRARYMTLEPQKNKYIKYFKNIRTISKTLCDEAKERNIPSIDNTNIDRSLATIHYNIFNCIKRLEDGDSLLDSESNNTKTSIPQPEKYPPYPFWNSKQMLSFIHEKKRPKARKTQKRTSGRSSGDGTLSDPERGGEKNSSSESDSDSKKDVKNAEKANAEKKTRSPKPASSLRRGRRCGSETALDEVLKQKAKVHVRFNINHNSGDSSSEEFSEEESLNTGTVGEKHYLTHSDSSDHGSSHSARTGSTDVSLLLGS